MITYYHTLTGYCLEYPEILVNVLNKYRSKQEEDVVFKNEFSFVTDELCWVEYCRIRKETENECAH